MLKHYKKNLWEKGTFIKESNFQDFGVKQEFSDTNVIYIDGILSLIDGIKCEPSEPEDENIGYDFKQPQNEEDSCAGSLKLSYTRLDGYNSNLIRLQLQKCSAICFLTCRHLWIY